MRVSVEIGKRYGKWLVEANAERRRNEQYFVCVCACGSRSEIRKSILVKGESGCAHWIGRAHVWTPVTSLSRMPSSA